MQYNLAQNSYISPNLVEGNKNLTYPQILDLVVENDANITLSGSDILSVEMDLGERILATEIRYYFTSNTPSSTVVSGVSFYCKLGPEESYFKLDSLVDVMYYYATITGTSYAPRHVKLVHTVSGTSISGTATALQIINNDTLVEFGEDGNRTAERFDLSLYYDPDDVKEVAVYNSSQTSADAYVALEPQYGLIDTLLEIGPTASGEWYGAFDADDKICGPDRWTNSYNYYNNTTSFSGTYIYDNAVRLYYTNTIGTYTTCVFGGPEYPSFVPMLLGADYPILSSGIAFSDNFNTLVGTNWQVLNGTVSYTNGDLRATHNSPNVVNLVSQNFGSDWEVLMKIMWYSNGYNSYYPEDYRQEFFPYYVSDNEYCMLRFHAHVSYNTIRFFMNGVLLHTNTTYNALNDHSNWFWFRTKRTRTEIKYKLWKDGTSEPNWAYTQSINNLTFPSFYSKIRFYAYGINSPYTNYRADDITLWSNCSAAGESNHLLAVDSTDTVETVQLKSTNAKPTDYNVYTTFSGVSTGGTYYVRSYLRYFENDSIRNQKDFYSAGIGSYPFSGYGVISTIDASDETVWSVVMATRPSNTASVVLTRWVQLTDVTTSITVYSRSSGTTINCDFRFLIPNKYNGCWMYFKTTEGVLNGSGYYLRYYDSALNATFSLRESQTDFVGGMCLANANSDLWYSNKYLSTILKINTSGATLASYDATDSISIVHSDGVNGCYVLQGEAILRLNASAQLLYTVSVGPDVYNFCIDKDTGGFWLLYQSFQIINITNDGMVNFSSPIYTYYITDIISVNGGVWFKCIDDKKWRFFDSRQKKITKEIYTPTSGGVDLPGFTNTPLFFSKPFNEDDFDNRFPVPTDTHWQNLSWRKISPRNYLLPRDKYHQIKFTFRASTPGGTTPILNYLYRQPVVKLENIPSGGSKNVYVKADISSLNETQLGHYTSNLRTWWYIPE